VSGSCDKKGGFLVEENPNKTEVSVLKSCIFIFPKGEKGRVEKDHSWFGGLLQNC